MALEAIQTNENISTKIECQWRQPSLCVCVCVCVCVFVWSEPLIIRSKAATESFWYFVVCCCETFIFSIDLFAVVFSSSGWGNVRFLEWRGLVRFRTFIFFFAHHSTRSVHQKRSANPKIRLKNRKKNNRGTSLNLVKPCRNLYNPKKISKTQ